MSSKTVAKRIPCISDVIKGILMNRSKEIKKIVSPLLDWYDSCARTLPWRSDPTPYHVWISEIMLQQTRVSAAIEYYLRFIKELPDPLSLSRVDDDHLMKLWQGLGYYSRAGNLKKAACLIAEEYEGNFPDTFDEIRKLPGIGDYTAGAISSIAFGLPVPAVDGNVLRVMSRLLLDQRPIDEAEIKKDIRDWIAEAIPSGRPGDFNQALMDLGATVCLPNGAPLCARCPLSEYCLARKAGKETELPKKAPKKPRRIEERLVYLIHYENKTALRRRPKKGLLAGLWELPNEPDSAPDPLKEWGFSVLSKKALSRHTHIFSHVEWRMQGIEITVGDDALPRKGEWVWAEKKTLDELYALPSAFSAFRPFL